MVCVFVFDNCAIGNFFRGYPWFLRGFLALVLRGVEFQTCEGVSFTKEDHYSAGLESFIFHCGLEMLV